MKTKNGRLVLEIRNCICCRGTGKTAARVKCPTCNGTGRGPRGGRDGCRTCHGMRTTYDQTQRETCGVCEGCGIVPETVYDDLPREIWQTLTFKVYRSERPQTLLEGLIGAGCWSCTDYGRHNNMTDAELIHEVATGNHHRPQAVKVVTADLCLPDHVGIFCNAQGYSVLAVHGS